MILRFPLRNIKDMLLNQISNNFFKSIDDELLITKHMPMAMERLENTISQIDIDNKYYKKENERGEEEAYFDPLHTCQWLMFLYFMANTIYKYELEKTEAARIVCDKIYGQSRAMSGCDLYYEVELPTAFFFEHPTGSVIGRAVYGEHFSFTQNCTVEGTDGQNPVIGNNVQMHSNTMILGNSRVGNNCVLYSGTVIKNEVIPDNSAVSGKSPNLIIEGL